MLIRAYLTFNGCCREAMSWYRECLGGELFLQEIGTSHMGSSMPDEMKSLILHAALIRGPLLILGSDLSDANSLIRGNTVTLALECDSEDELMECYQKLAKGSISKIPPELPVWGNLVGNVTDKYGNQWLLHCNTFIESENYSA